MAAKIIAKDKPALVGKAGEMPLVILYFNWVSGCGG